MTQANISLREDQNQYWFLTIITDKGETNVSIGSTNARKLIEQSNMPFSDPKTGKEGIKIIPARASIDCKLDGSYTLYLEIDKGVTHTIPIRDKNFTKLSAIGIKQTEP